jgi:hypothetical protein
LFQNNDLDLGEKGNKNKDDNKSYKKYELVKTRNVLLSSSDDENNSFVRKNFNNVTPEKSSI